MHSQFRNGAIALALLTSAGVAVAQTSPAGPGGAAPSGRTETQMKQDNMLQLSAAQKSAIFQSVTKEKVKSPPPANLPISVGAQLPASIELYPLPANVVTQIPAAKTYRYTVAQNQVVLVDPATMKIVEIIKQ